MTRAQRSLHLAFPALFAALDSFVAMPTIEMSMTFHGLDAAATGARLLGPPA